MPMAGATKRPDGNENVPGGRRRKTTEGGGPVDYQHLSTLLWREQELLDLLLFKAGEEQYLILIGKTRWLPRIHPEDQVAAADRARDRGGARPAAHPRGRAGRGHRGARHRARHRLQPVAAPARR